jgi:predicted DsbA family dithiol-disulfide isomerase
MDPNEKMEVEIWSDIMCPFCYLGKHNFTKALGNFAEKDKVRITWRSFQLNPKLRTQPGVSIDEFLAASKGISEEHARQLHEQVTARGEEAGLEYRFGAVVVANTLLAHKFLHFAKRYSKQDEAQGRLFKAYFTEGKNVDDAAVLAAMAEKMGLDAKEWQNAQNDPSLLDEVKKEIHEARELGIQGVPFFLFDRKYAVSGAREPGVFLGALQQSFSAWQKH